MYTDQTPGMAGGRNRVMSVAVSSNHLLSFEGVHYLSLAHLFPVVAYESNRIRIGWMDGWVDGWVDGWMRGWMGGWVGGWVDGWVAYLFTSLFCFLFSSINSSSCFSLKKQTNQLVGLTGS